MISLIRGYVPDYVKRYRESRDYSELRNLMFSLPIALRASIIVETGLSRGLSTRIFLEAAKILYPLNGTIVYTYDIEDSPNTRERLVALDLTMHWVFTQQDSIQGAREWSNRPGVARDIDLLYLDSDHSKTHVAAELREWGKSVRRPGGVILVDDCLEGTGTLEAVKESEFHSVTFLDAEGMALLWT